jgi:hypothetical protein
MPPAAQRRIERRAWIVAVFALVGVVGSAALVLFQSVALLERSRPVTGTVVSLSGEPDDSRRKAEIRYEAGGVTRTVTEWVFGTHQVDDAFELRYDPKDPATAFPADLEPYPGPGAMLAVPLWLALGLSLNLAFFLWRIRIRAARRDRSSR